MSSVLSVIFTIKIVNENQIVKSKIIEEKFINWFIQF